MRLVALNLCSEVPLDEMRFSNGWGKEICCERPPVQAKEGYVDSEDNALGIEQEFQQRQQRKV